MNRLNKSSSKSIQKEGFIKNSIETEDLTKYVKFHKITITLKVIIGALTLEPLIVLL
jgi:hypothetical protein